MPRVVCSVGCSENNPSPSHLLPLTGATAKHHVVHGHRPVLLILPTGSCASSVMETVHASLGSPGGRTWTAVSLAEKVMMLITKQSLPAYAWPQLFWSSVCLFIAELGTEQSLASRIGHVLAVPSGKVWAVAWIHVAHEGGYQAQGVHVVTRQHPVSHRVRSDCAIPRGKESLTKHHRTWLV